VVFEFKFPDVGEGITEGEIVKWRVKEGDTVKQDQIVADIETDKAIVEVPIPKAGKILKLHANEGDTIKVGSVLVTVGEEGEAAPAPKEEKPAEAPKEEAKPVEAPKEEVKEEKPKGSVGVVGSLPEYEEPKKVTPITEEGKKVEVKKAAPKALPSVRKLAEEKGIDLSTVTPTGPEGSVTKEDVLATTGEVKPKTSAVVETKAGIKIIKREYDLYGYLEKIPLKGIRKAVATHMTIATQKTAPVTHFDEIDVTHLYEIRKKEKDALEKKGIKLTFLPFIVKSVIAALKKHPYLNASLDDVNQEIIVKKYYNIGIAVDAPDGLIVPVIKIADKKNVEQLAAEMERLSTATRNRTINLGDLRGGTFTITNIGAIGGLFATPIINYPEVAILLTGRIHDKQIVVNGNPLIRKILPISLTFDHRVVDGAEAARFANDLKAYLEDPDKLLIELE